MENENFYGVKGVKFLYKNNSTDPAVIYKNHVFDYYDIEDSLYSDFKDDFPNGTDDRFEKWVVENSEDVYSLLDEMIQLKMCDNLHFLNTYYTMLPDDTMICAYDILHNAGKAR